MVGKTVYETCLQQISNYRKLYFMDIKLFSKTLGGNKSQNNKK